MKKLGCFSFFMEGKIINGTSPFAQLDTQKGRQAGMKVGGKVGNKEGGADLFLPGNQWWDTWKSSKAVPREIQTGPQEAFFYQEGGWTLEQASWTGGRCLKPVSVEEALDNALDNVL